MTCQQSIHIVFCLVKPGSRAVDLDEMLREFREWLVEKLESIPSDTERFLLFVAWLSTALERYGCRVVVTGVSLSRSILVLLTERWI